MSAVLDAITAELSSSTPVKATRRAAKAVETTPVARGFTVAKASPVKLAEAKAVMVQYLNGAAKGKYPSVAFNPQTTDKPQNFACMLAVGFIQGWMNDADGSAKVCLIQQAYKIQPANRKLGFPAMASSSATVREKTMRAIGAQFIGRANKAGLFKLEPTKPSERVAVNAIRGNGKLTGDKPVAKGKAKVADTTRRNGPVTVTVDKALKSAAAKAERATQRAANRAAQAAQGAPASE